MRKEIIIFLIILSVLFVVGCADNGASEKPALSTPVEGIDEGEIAGTVEAATGTRDDIIDVKIQGYKYIPQNLTVKVGQTVKWTNNDTVLHDVVGSGIESEYLQKGEAFTYTFEKEGTYQYICTIHPWMEGKVIVEV
ncbi:MULTISPECIES: cupredoxin family copper-binding protein [unclassified Methanosarcina]|uniref:cupredoxin domain-containing protein n=1 Tax=unclassified Methanosarcina TaxID=2644672 RepID=UPI0006157CCA|nr:MULTISPECIES: cupredoxin family copper-binding protein [unclassified Methanosarcina]AKB19919.1 copper binding protein, plastocyanin/azurin family [Methanosarcina sp. WWM596]AKB22285.1 copper binding protein, plastocyanin/azurin family [Methanosarcina sp. WH1]